MLKKAVEIEDGKNYAVEIAFYAVPGTNPFGVAGGIIDLQLGQGAKQRIDLTSSYATFSSVDTNPTDPRESVQQIAFYMNSVVVNANDKFLNIYTDFDLENAVIQAVSVREVNDIELLTNGDFSGSATGWTLGAHWAYTSNKIRHTWVNNSINNPADYATQTIASTGSNYKIINITTETTGGTHSDGYINFVGMSGGTQINTKSAGNRTAIMQGGTVFTLISITDVAISHISIKEITGVELVNTDGWTIDDGWRSTEDGIVTGYGDAEFEFGQPVTIEQGETYRLSFDVDGLFEDYIIGDTSKDQLIYVHFGFFGPYDLVYTGHINAAHISVDIVAPNNADDMYFNIDSEPGTYGLLILGNISFKKLTAGVEGPELLTNGDFANGLDVAWDFEDKYLWGVRNNNFIYLRRFAGNEFLQTITMVASDLNGNIQTINAGTSDDGTPIYYELETQELEFGNRANLKQIADKLTVFGKNTDSTQLQAQENDGDFKNIPLAMDKTVNIGKDINLEGNFFKFRWSGESDSESPIIDGLTIENISDKGITKS